jgi:transcriptional regulator with XRE-family HTH domain
VTNPPLLGLTMRREFHCLTQAQMAEVANMTQSQYQKFEKGAVRLDIYRAKLFATRLDCTIDDLL